MNVTLVLHVYNDEAGVFVGADAAAATATADTLDDPREKCKLKEINYEKPKNNARIFGTYTTVRIYLAVVVVVSVALSYFQSRQNKRRKERDSLEDITSKSFIISYDSNLERRLLRYR